MSIAPGTRLGPYEILQPIGAGGMGEVYKARDTRLNRTVAIKVLPPHISTNPEARQRFEREAQTIASLKHPNICILHDIGRQGGTDYLVMEFIEGETLANRLTRGPLPLDQALKVAVEIADALDKAHRQGITHRDLKPGNIMLTKSGSKLLDFGLAKLKTAQHPELQASNLPTGAGTLNPTAQGTILGTLQYMSPEQLEGLEADARTDIFAFGAVLYEMITGKRAFQGQSQASLIGAIMQQNPPPISSIEKMSPPELDRIVAACTAKDPEERIQAARDLVRELKWLSDPAAASTAAGPRPRQYSIWKLVAPVALATLILGAVIAWRFKPEASPNGGGIVTRATISVEPADQLGRNYMGAAGTALVSVRPGRTAFALSPDGRDLVFSGTRGEVTQLYLRPLDRVSAAPIAGTENGQTPFFSPDGQWIGFWADNKLKKIPLAGGPAVVICDAPANAPTGGIYGASWGDGGTIVFSAIVPPARTLSVVSSAGGTPHIISKSDLAKYMGLPQVLPGGKFVLFTFAPKGTAPKIAVQSLAGGDPKILIDGGSDARYAPAGQLIFMREATLMAVPFDLQKLELTGTPAPILDGVMYAEGAPNATLDSLAGQFSVSSSGTLVYATGGIHPGLVGSIFFVDRNGKTEKTIAEPISSYFGPRISPDGKSVVGEVASSDADLWLLDLVRRVPSRLTFKGGSRPVWSPDGRDIAFSSPFQAVPSIYLIPADGSQPPERLTTSSISQTPVSWSRTDNMLAFLEGGKIWVLPMAGGDRKPRLFLEGKAGTLTYPQFSPDGRWMAYASTESGRNEIYVSPYPGPGGAHRISTEGGQEPLWNPNGRELFYRNGRQVLAVDVVATAGFTAATPKSLFEGDFSSGSPVRNYDITPDGKYFVMVRNSLPLDEKPVTQLHIVLNWTQELKQRVPVK